MIQLKRVYDPATPEDGVRYLVDRMWPRGIRKTDLVMEDWLKDVAPSLLLCKWFSHDPAKWAEFQQRYLAELNANTDACEPILEAARKGCVTLLYASRETKHNNAVALKAYLETKKR